MSLGLKGIFSIDADSGPLLFWFFLWIWVVWIKWNCEITSFLKKVLVFVLTFYYNFTLFSIYSSPHGFTNSPFSRILSLPTNWPLRKDEAVPEPEVESASYLQTSQFCNAVRSKSLKDTGYWGQFDLKKVSKSQGSCQSLQNLCCAVVKNIPQI